MASVVQKHRSVKSPILVALLLSACGTTPNDHHSDDPRWGGKCDSDTSSPSAPVWSRDASCTVTLIDDTSAALLCPSWIEVVELADGATRWRADFDKLYQHGLYVHGDDLWF